MKMKKIVSHAFGKDTYLLGVDHNGKYHWLEAPSWDCDWYYSWGYIETYTNNKNPQAARDVVSHTHWDSLFMSGSKNAYDAFKEFFVTTPLSDDELWQLCDLMSSFYVLKSAARLFLNGNSHYTEKASLTELIDTNLVKHINEVMLPAVFKKAESLFVDNPEDTTK